VRPGDTFDRYEIVELLGEGGMGRVYAAHDPKLGRRIALKILTVHGAPEPGGSQGPARMLREARAAAAFDHPNAVAIFDVGEADGTPYIAMELIEGKPLRWYVGRADVPWARRLRWLVDVAHALGAAHERGLVHRDVKPENVMVREDGVVKVLDFGIARVRDAPVDPTGATEVRGLDAITAEGVVIGTPRYMSPEQLRGDPLDGRSDQFAWGVVAYELLSGRSPWRTAEPSLRLVAEVLTQTPGALDAPEIPEVVERAVTRALEKDPAKRFRSMEAAARVLEPYASGSSRDLDEAVSTLREPEGAPSGSPPSSTEITSASTSGRERAAPAPPRPRLPRVWMAVAALVVVATVVVALLRGSTTPSAQAPGLDAAPRPTAVTDLPDPKTTSPQALVAYRAAQQAWRDGLGGVDVRFRRAVALDPDLGAAQLRLSFATAQSAPDESRAAFERALAMRGELDDHDRTLLHSLEPILFDQPPDGIERHRRLTAAVLRYPLDAELWYHLGANAGGGLYTITETSAFEKAVEIDPAFARAWWQLGQAHAYRGEMAAARDALDRCLAISHSATSCLWNRICIDEIEGRCDAVEADARRWAKADASDPLGRFAVAAALVARGASLESVEEALRQQVELEAEAERPKAAAYDAMRIALLRGDFDAALEHARRYEGLVSRSPVEAEHRPAAAATIEATLESGKAAEAARFADSYAKRREAWLGDTLVEDFALAADIHPALFRALRAASAASAAELERRRTAWIADVEKHTARSYMAFAWVWTWAAVAETRAEAERALGALAALEGRGPPAYTPKSLATAYIGRVYVLAGKPEVGLPFLERAAASCLALELPVDHVRAHLWLGQAREATGDVPGACKAYAVVLQRWGAAKPRSVTADAARARMRTLRCTP
jgi:serine/threonine-protein kinase